MPLFACWHKECSHFLSCGASRKIWEKLRRVWNQVPHSNIFLIF